MAGPRKDPLDAFLDIPKHRGTSSNTQGVAVNLVKISKAGFREQRQIRGHGQVD